MIFNLFSIWNNMSHFLYPFVQLLCYQIQLFNCKFPFFQWILIITFSPTWERSLIVVNLSRYLLLFFRITKSSNVFFSHIHCKVYQIFTSIVAGMEIFCLTFPSLFIYMRIQFFIELFHKIFQSFDSRLIDRIINLIYYSFIWWIILHQKDHHLLWIYNIHRVFLISIPVTLTVPFSIIIHWCLSWFIMGPNISIRIS